MTTSRSTRHATSSKTRCRGKQPVGTTPPACAAGRNTPCVETRTGPLASGRTSPPPPWSSPAPSWRSARPRLSTTPSDAAASWLAGELTDGLMHNGQFGDRLDDYGLTSTPGSLSLPSAHTRREAQVIRDALADHVNDYVTPGRGPPLLHRRLAKLPCSPVTAGGPHFYGGQNLITQLEARVATTTPIAGSYPGRWLHPGISVRRRLRPISSASPTPHDALTAAGSAKKTSVTNYLLKQQCSSGYFRLNFSAKTRPTRRA